MIEMKTAKRKKPQHSPIWGCTGAEPILPTCSCVRSRAHLAEILDVIEDALLQRRVRLARAAREQLVRLAVLVLVAEHLVVDVDWAAPALADDVRVFADGLCLSCPCWTAPVVAGVDWAAARTQRPFKSGSATRRRQRKRTTSATARRRALVVVA